MRWRIASIALLTLLVLGAFGIGNTGIGNTHFIAKANNANHYRFMGTYDDQNNLQILVDPPYANLTVGQELTVTINATNVASMGAWQVVLKFNVTVINVTAMWVPTDNVFGDPALFLHEEVDMEYGIDYTDGMGYALYGNARIFYPDVSVTNGTLCKANFTALSTGTTSLLIATPKNYVALLPENYSWLATWSDQYQWYQEVPFPPSVKSGVVSVVPEFPSFLILAIFMTAILVTLIVYKRKHIRARRPYA